MNELSIALELIDPNPYQPRAAEDLEAVRELATDILHHATDDFDGLMQIPTVRQVDGRYQLAFGHTRKAAFNELFLMGHDRYACMRVNVRELSDLQMFELAVAENIKRRDLNPIEQAEAMHKYMNKFGKTSKEAGEFFNCSEENVRAKVRLLNLPEAAREKVRAGDINENTARLVLTVQKIGGEEAVAEAIDNLLNDEARFYDNPEEAIGSALDDAPNVVSMPGHIDWRDEKKFPVKYLVPISRKLLASTLDVAAGDKARKEMLDQLETLIASGMEIQDNQWGAFLPRDLEKVRTLANPPACLSCPFHAVIDHSHYCGLKPCFERKADAWDKSLVAKAVKDTGIALYVNEATDGAAVELDRWNKEDRKLFEERHADLRLKPSNSGYGNFEGLPRNVKLIAVGKTAQKRLAKREKALEKGQAERVDREMEDKIRHVRNDAVVRFIYEVIAPTFAPLFEGFTNLPFAMFVYENAMFDAADFPNNADDRETQVEQITKSKKKADAIKQLHTLMALEVMDRALEWSSYDGYDNSKTPVVECAKRAQKLADQWNLKLPKNWMNEAEAHEAVLDAAVKDLISKWKAAK